LKCQQEADASQAEETWWEADIDIAGGGGGRDTWWEGGGKPGKGGRKFLGSYIARQ
jgi:hypothetical protein